MEKAETEWEDFYALVLGKGIDCAEGSSALLVPSDLKLG